MKEKDTINLENCEGVILIEEEKFHRHCGYRNVKGKQRDYLSGT